MELTSKGSVVAVSATLVGAKADTLTTLDDPEVLDQVRQSASGPLVMLVQPGESARVRRQLVISITSEDHPWALLPMDFPPLALTVAADIVSAALTEHDLHVALSIAHQIDSIVLSATLLSSVSGVDDPAPTVAQTARSMLPGGRFVVSHGIHRGVSDAKTNPAGSNLVPIASGAHQAPDWATSLAQQWAPEALPQEVQPGAVLGADRWLQLVWIDSARLEQEILHASTRDRRDCAWCGLPTVVATCHFCGHYDDTDAKEGNPA